MRPQASNPFSAQGRADARAKVLAAMNAAPKPEAPQAEPEAPRAEAQASSPAAEPAATKASEPEPTKAPEAPDPHEWVKRERAVAALEAKAREAEAKAAKQASELEARHKKAEAAIKKAQMMRTDPVGFLAEIGITEDEFTGLLKQGGKRTAEQTRLAENESHVAELRAELKAMRDEQARERASMAQAREDAAFSQTMTTADYPLLNRLGGVPVVRAKQSALSETLGRDVTLQEAAQHTEAELLSTFKGLLGHSDIRGKLGLGAELASAVAQSDAKGSKGPRTLNSAVASSPGGNPRFAWEDMAGKKRHILEQLARGRTD